MQPCKYKHWINFPSVSKRGEVEDFPMKIYKCFKRLSITTWACAGFFLNTTYAEGKNDSCVTYPKLLYSDHSLKLVSAEGRVGCKWIEGQSGGARVSGFVFGRQDEEASLRSD